MQPDDLSATECKFRCSNGECLELVSLICDQLNNCGDNSDEEHCPTVTPPPTPSHPTLQTELAFVQIVIVIVVMTVMVVVIVCLLNHYRLSAWALISRLNRSRDHSMPEGCSWPTDSLVTQPGSSEVMYGPRGQDRCNPPSFQQRENPWRFQPTYPYLPQGIDLPPSISLSDGEELPPYKGPCTLQLRDPEQQQELSRASVRAPPNRTVFDSDLVDVYVHGGGGPRPPSSNSGKSASSNRPEGPPPTYSEVMAQSGANPAPFLHQHSNNAPPPAQQPGTQSGTRKLAAV